VARSKSRREGAVPAGDDDRSHRSIRLDPRRRLRELANYLVYAFNPMSAARYRDRHAVSGGKSDRGDAHVLADLVRTDRHHHRTVAVDSELLARSRSPPGPTRT
jgi:hypothetical protein